MQKSKKGGKKPEEPKKKKLFFPKSDLKLDDFKKFVVNTPDLNKKMSYVKEKHDPNAYSFWKLTYDKLEDELVARIYSENLLTGFLDRCEGFRKYAYGVHCLVG